jgi:hypothetical protein
MDRERCLLILEGYGTGPNMVRLIRLAGSNHGLLHIRELRGTVLCWPRHDPGGPLSLKLFNILVDTVVREWLCQLRDGGIVDLEELDLLMAAFFAIFMLMMHILPPETPTSYR